MPLPFILIGVAGTLGLFGTKKGYDAYSDRGKATGLNKEAQDIFNQDKHRLGRARTSACGRTEGFGPAET